MPDLCAREGRTLVTAPDVGRSLEAVRDPRLGVVAGVLVVQGSAGRGVAGALHELGKSGAGQRDERHT